MFLSCRQKNYSGTLILCVLFHEYALKYTRGHCLVRTPILCSCESFQKHKNLNVAPLYNIKYQVLMYLRRNNTFAVIKTFSTPNKVVFYSFNSYTIFLICVTSYFNEKQYRRIVPKTVSLVTGDNWMSINIIE